MIVLSHYSHKHTRTEESTEDHQAFLQVAKSSISGK